MERLNNPATSVRPLKSKDFEPVVHGSSGSMGIINIWLARFVTGSMMRPIVSRLKPVSCLTLGQNTPHRLFRSTPLSSNFFLTTSNYIKLEQCADSAQTNSGPRSKHLCVARKKGSANALTYPHLKNGS